MPVRSLAVLLAFLLTGAATARADDSVDLDDEYKGTTKADDHTKRTQKLTTDAVQIALKAGQRVELSVTVAGDGREVALILWDANGSAVAASGGVPRATSPPFQLKKLSELEPARVGDAQRLLVVSPKKASIVIGEVPATGKYTLRVYSVGASAYVLTTKDLSKVRDADAIERELKAARDRVEALEKELREAKRQKKPN